MRTWETVVFIALSCLIATGAKGQVRTVTLGITTHCPYGVGGCWAEIRNGLNLPEAIEAIPQRPDTTTQTFDLHMRQSWTPDPGLFAKNFAAMNVGVDVRGVEAMVDGTVEHEGTNLVLRVGPNGPVLRLARLTQKVQWDVKRKRPETPSRAERRAFEKIAERPEPGRIRVTGPLTRSGSILTLEVRKFQILPRV